ncbi:MAG TPA: glycoside hydrolase family 15 protein [Hydrogenophaga sp.]|uniref:glycoside hydrolase family 15 protein n=1 Tax=Hydrogenophaga sp. TaxID=1904254 RepID=UPI002B5B70DD|nr:glycoside hydrolase family 15 protein [Hydrogenophaga sp.]HSX93591.1 glycoside hydrolase family 15 protein [Hydrogenophaga sp.]
MTTPASGFASPEPASLHMGVIGNCTISALIDARARVVWSCMPRFDADPVFCSLLGGADGASGSWAIELEDLAETRQRYEPNTAVLVTELWDRHGQGLQVTDFAPRFASRGRFFRPMQITRRVRALKGTPRIRVHLAPRFEWGARAPTITSGSNHVRYVGDHLTLRLYTDAPISHVLSGEPFLLVHEHNFLLGPDETIAGSVSDVARHFEQETRAYWRTWSQRLALPLEWQDAVIRAAITLKLSLFEDTGAIVAAMTTSIPEAAHTQRNWDYRYCWLRDAFFVVRALNSLSEIGTMEDYLRWLSDVVVGSARHDSSGHVQPLFGVGLERHLPERIVDSLPGYRGMGPVRVGNQAQEHFQHDVYGNIVLASSQAFHDHRLLHPPGRAEFERLEAVGEHARRVFDQPDAGMWELRTRARVHTSSALMNWAACDRLAKIARTLHLPERAAYWAGHAQGMRERILNESWSEERQAFAESFGGRDLDASVLLMAEVGFIDPKDPRFLSTLQALETHLCDGPYMRRYEAPDDFGKPEVAFNICTFWRIDALSRTGRVREAREVFEAMLAVRNPLGLLSEDTHATTGEMWGNFPQTYSMVGLINAAVRLSAHWDSVV